MIRAAVDLGGRRLICEVARTASEQARGLQDHPPLREGEGMVFVFDPPRAATFWMGRVAFPIDVVFADAGGRIGRIVHNADPGTPARWSHPVVGAVLEVPGGYCARAGVSVGSQLRLADTRLGAGLRAVWAGINTPALIPGYSGTEPTTQRVMRPRRFRDHDLPDTQPNALDQPTDGLALGLADDGLLKLPELARDDSTDGARVTRSGARRQADYEMDPSEFVPDILEGAARAGLNWTPVVLNPDREQLIADPREVGRWIHAIGLPESQRAIVHQAATSQDGLDAIGAGFMAGGLASTAVVTHYGDQHVLVLTRKIERNGARSSARRSKEAAWT